MQSKGWDVEYTLQDAANGNEVNIGDVVEVNGVRYIILGGSPPHKPSSTGRVYVRGGDERYDKAWFANVCNMKWVPNE